MKHSSAVRAVLLLLPSLALAQSSTQSGPNATTPDAATPTSSSNPNPAPATMSAAPADVKTTPEPTFVIAKWKAKLYGFAELDTMSDSTQSFAEIQGNGVIAKPGTLGYDNGRTQATIRNSRLGFSLESPDFGGVKGYATIEGDFFGFDPAPFSATSAGNSEAGFYTNPTFRIRHSFVKIETPVIDILGGQYWTLLGFGPIFNPATVALQGIAGEIYQRTPQLRLGKSIALGGGSKLEIQGAALRPYQRDSAVPDFAGGVRLEIGGWTGYKSTGGSGSGPANLQFAVSGTLKQFRALPAKPVSDTDFQTASGSAIALDALIPIIPAPSKTSHAGALTFVGEASTGSGYNDAFTGLTAGTTVGAPPGVPTGTTYAANLDNGGAGFNSDTGVLDTVDYRSLLLNLQYYTPIADGNVWLSGVFTTVQSDNSGLFAKPGVAFTDQKYASLAVFYDLTPATRLGIEGAWTRQRMSDQTVRVDRRGLFSMWFIF